MKENDVLIGRVRLTLIKVNFCVHINLTNPKTDIILITTMSKFICVWERDIL